MLSLPSYLRCPLYHIPNFLFSIYFAAWGFCLFYLCSLLPYFLCFREVVAQRLKHLPAMRETWVGSLSQEDPLEKEMATHSSIVAWRIPWTEKPGGYSPRAHKELAKTERLTLSL